MTQWSTIFNKNSSQDSRSKRPFAAIPMKIHKVAVTGGQYFKDICTNNRTQNAAKSLFEIVGKTSVIDYFQIERLNVVSIQNTNPPTTN